MENYLQTQHGKIDQYLTKLFEEKNLTKSFLEIKLSNYFHAVQTEINYKVYSCLKEMQYTFEEIESIEEKISVEVKCEPIKLIELHTDEEIEIELKNIRNLKGQLYTLIDCYENQKECTSGFNSIFHPLFSQDEKYNREINKIEQDIKQQRRVVEKLLNELKNKELLHVVNQSIQLLKEQDRVAAKRNVKMKLSQVQNDFMQKNKDENTETFLKQAKIYANDLISRYNHVLIQLEIKEENVQDLNEDRDKESKQICVKENIERREKNVDIATIVEKISVELVDGQVKDFYPYELETKLSLETLKEFLKMIQ